MKQTLSLRERLYRFADGAREAASRLPVGAERECLMRKVDMTHKALELEGWLSSRELRPPV